MNILLSFIAVFVIIFIVPIVVYGVLSGALALSEPDKKASFLIGIAAQKVGTAVGFVWLYALMPETPWLMYAVAWFVMFAIVEIGQAIAPGYTREEALAGVMSEAIYFPAAAWAVSVLL